MVTNKKYKKSLKIKKIYKKILIFGNSPKFIKYFKKKKIIVFLKWFPGEKIMKKTMINMI